MNMVKVFSLVLMLGLALSPARAEEDGKEGKEIALTEDEAAPEPKLKDMDEVEKEGEKGKEGAKDPKLRGWSTATMSRKIIWGTSGIKRSCGCGSVIRKPEFEKIYERVFEKVVKKDDEMILTFKCTDGVKYMFKAKSDTKTIYWSQHVHGDWKEWKEIAIEDFDKYFGYSIIQWTENGEDLFGLVKGDTIVAWHKVEAMPYVVNRMTMDWFVKWVIENEHKTVKSYEIEWKGDKFVNWPENQPEYFGKPYFLPAKNRRVYWIIVKKSSGISVIPRPPKHHIEDHSNFEWPDFKLPSREVTIFPSIPDSFYHKYCWMDLRGVRCQESGSSHGGMEYPDDDSGSKSVGPGSRETGGESVIFGPIPHGGNIRIIPMEHSTETHHGKSCQCQKRCSCTMHKQRKKRSTANSYKEFLELTADCVSERRCRRAYSKFLKNGVIKVKSD